MSQTLSLSSLQEDKAVELLDELDSEMSPQDIVAEWKPTPSRVGLDWKDNGCEWVAVDAIVGTEKHNISRLEHRRLASILEKMIHNEFEKQYRLLPVLCKIEDEYYVDADGNHRVLAHKYLDIEEIYVEVVEYW